MVRPRSFIIRFFILSMMLLIEDNPFPFIDPNSPPISAFALLGAFCFQLIFTEYIADVVIITPSNIPGGGRRRKLHLLGVRDISLEHQPIVFLRRQVFFQTLIQG